MRHKVVGFLLVLLAGCSARVETPQAASAAVAADAGDGSSGLDAGEDVDVVVGEAGEAGEVAVDEAVDVGAVEVLVSTPMSAPTSMSLLKLPVAQRFVLNGGPALCRAMVYALNPEWRMDACRALDDDHRAACEASRAPLVQFTADVCGTVIAESLRLDFDPAMVLAVIERESSFGRAIWDRSGQQYEVQTDVCRLTLAKSRIVERRPGKREGTEVITWTYGPSAPDAGAVARNRQPVRVVAEDETAITVDTCAAGEGGIMQTTPRELHVAGDLVGLTGSTARRRAALDADPTLQVRVGCQALAEHRDLCPADRRGAWDTWLPAYNLGTCEPAWTQWREYLRKVAQGYLLACTNGWIPVEGGVPRLVHDVWPECGRVQAACDALHEEE